MKKKLIDWTLLILGITLFALPQPSLLFHEGVPFLSYIAFFPISILVRRVSWKTVWLYGMLYGIGACCLFTTWLATFHPMGLSVISIVYGIHFMLVFMTLKAVWLLCGTYSWIAQWIVWCAYEYLKALGFVGFNYGVTAYSHWQLITLIQCVDLIGIWGLSAIIIFPSAWFSIVLQPLFAVRSGNTSVVPKMAKSTFCIKDAVYAHRTSGIVWIAVFLAIIIYGVVSQVDYLDYDTKKVALIQVNSDWWERDMLSDAKKLPTLQRLTDEALAEHDNVDFVVWSETAFVPSIRWLYKYRDYNFHVELVEELLNYINTKDVPFVLGNVDTIKGDTSIGEQEKISYNAAFLFRPGENVIPPDPEMYYKMHLVPFTEYFPFEKMFPSIYDALLKMGMPLLAPGTDSAVFTLDGLSFGTPICFEDTFGYISRKFAQNGAQLIVTLANVSWANSVAAQYQHLSMAVFRSVENRIPSVRSSTSGQTAIIDPNGKVTAMIEPFVNDYLVGEFPIMEKDRKTLYTLWGDYVGILFVVLAAILLIGGLVKKILLKTKGIYKKNIRSTK